MSSDKGKKSSLRNAVGQLLGPVIAVVVASFVFMFILLVILRLLDGELRSANSAFIDLFRFDGGVEAWFAFYGALFGVIATVVIAIITFRLDKNSQYRELSTQINKLSLHEIRLYDMKRDYRPSVLEKDGDSQRFVLLLTFDKFDPYYEIKIEGAEWSDIASEKGLEINPQSGCIKNAEKMVIYLNFDDVKTKDTEDNVKTEDTFNYFYQIKCYNAGMMELRQRQRKLKLEMLFERELHNKICEKAWVDLIITLENGGYQEGYMKLEEKNCLLHIRSFYREKIKRKEAGK